MGTMATKTSTDAIEALNVRVDAGLKLAVHTVALQRRPRGMQPWIRPYLEAALHAALRGVPVADLAAYIESHPGGTGAVNPTPTHQHNSCADAAQHASGTSAAVSPRSQGTGRPVNRARAFRSRS